MADETAATETGAPQTSPETADSQPNGAKRKKLLRILAIVVVTVAILWGLWYFLTQAGRVHTDNAYVGAASASATAIRWSASSRMTRMSPFFTACVPLTRTSFTGPAISAVTCAESAPT